MAKFVRIQSTKPITVTGGLQSIDMTDERSLNPDKLNVKPSWTSFRVQLRAGAGYYPARVKDWPSVKVLSSKEVLTVGQTVDALPENYEYKKEAEALYDTLEREYAKYEKQIGASTKAKASAKKAQKQVAAQENLFDTTED